MDEKFVKNVMGAHIDPKVVMDLSLFKFGGWKMTTRQTFTEDMVGDWSMRSSQSRSGSKNGNVCEIVPMQVLHGCVARLGLFFIVDIALRNVAQLRTCKQQARC